MGIFITFEGCDGAGKTTQAALLAGRVGYTHEVVPLYEPGGTSLGDLVHRYVRSHRTIESTVNAPEQGYFEELGDGSFRAQVDAIAELLLFAASRAQLVSEVIRPALERDAVVICDRFADSTLAYQGYGRGLSPDEVIRINEIATGGTWPDLTILLDIDPDKALSRVPHKKDLMERQSLDFHRHVREGYLTIASNDPNRFLVLDATMPTNFLQAEIWNRVSSLIGLNEAIPAQRLL